MDKRWSQSNNRAALCILRPNGLTGGHRRKEAAKVEATPQETHQKDQECGSNVNIGLVTLHFNVEKSNQLWRRWSVNDDPKEDANKMAKTISTDLLSPSDFRQMGQFADTSPTHWHVNPQTSPLFGDFLWTLLAGLHQRASHVLMSQKHPASARQQTAIFRMVTYKKKKSILKR